MFFFCAGYYLECFNLFLILLLLRVLILNIYVSIYEADNVF
jgi:hypothetical protein